MTENFLPFKGGVTTTGGKLLAVNPNSVAAIYSAWSKAYREYLLTLLLNNDRQIRIRGEDAAQALEELGLGTLADGWILDLVEDL